MLPSRWMDGPIQPALDKVVEAGYEVTAEVFVHEALINSPRNCGPA